MHDMEIEKSLKAVGRAGAGVNNIPLQKMSDNGVVVFNTPGANANAVKELVISSMLLQVEIYVKDGVMLMIFHLTILKLQLKMEKTVLWI